MWRNWSFPSNAAFANLGRKQTHANPITSTADCSDDEDASSCCSSREEEGLECPICWESFNIVENIPYVLWCGHTLCKNCVLGLQRAVVKLPTVPIQLPFFITCPWCNLLSLRLVHKGNLKFPCKNFFIVSMVENMNRERTISQSSFSHGDHQQQHAWPSQCIIRRASPPTHVHREHPRQENPNGENQLGNASSSWRKSLALFVHLTSKFPLVVMLLVIILYAIPASAAILALYVLITAMFALPSFLILYYAYPSLDWLIREIIT